MTDFPYLRSLFRKHLEYACPPHKPTNLPRRLDELPCSQRPRSREESSMSVGAIDSVDSESEGLSTFSRRCETAVSLWVLLENLFAIHSSLRETFVAETGQNLRFTSVCEALIVRIAPYQARVDTAYT